MWPCFKLFDYWQKVKAAPKLSKELQQEAFLVSNVLIDLREALASAPNNTRSHRTTSALTDTATEFGKLMVEMFSCIEVKKDEVLKRLKWPLDQKENENYLSKLERFKATFILVLRMIQGYPNSPSGSIVGKHYKQ